MSIIDVNDISFFIILPKRVWII